MAISPYVYPARLDPLNNITPMTYRNGTSMARLLEDIRVYVLEQLPGEMNELLGKFFTDFSAALGDTRDAAELSRTEQAAIFNQAIAEINAVIETINNKSGAVDIQRAVLSGPYTVTIDPAWPTNQPVNLALEQDATGNRSVTLGAGIEGFLTVESYPHGVTEFTLVPGGDGTWTVVQVPALINTRAQRVDNAAAKRLRVGARVSMPGNADELPGAQYFDETHRLEAAMGARFDMVSWYGAVNADVVNRYRSEVVPELTANPDRGIMYALEIFRTNDAFLAEFDSQGNVYTYLRDLFTLVKESGTDERVAFAPFHEGNGSGGNYPWGMYAEGNSIEKYAQCFQRVVTLARSLGLKSKFIQWFLTSNSGGADDSRDIAKGYVGDAWADIIGVSYYNRATDGSTETAVGGTLTRFMRHVEAMSSRPVWICETGCYPSLPTHDKGMWYANLIKLAASDTFPRLEAVCLFMVDSDVLTSKTLENTEQKKRVGEAINGTRRTNSYGNPADMTRNLIPRSVAVPSKTSDWTKYGAPGLPDLTLTISTDVPDDMDEGDTSLCIYKPFNTGISTDYRVYRPVAPGDVDFVRNRVHTTGFWAKAEYDGFRIGFGVRQSGGNLVAGDSRIELSTQWEYYNSPFATGIDPGSAWQFPHMSFGDNGPAGRFWITGMQITRGSHPTPDVSKVLVPRIKTADATPANITVNCEAADTWIVALTGDRTLNAPVGAAYDGQIVTVRVRQDAVGTRVLTRNTADTRWFVSSESMTGQLTTAPFSQALVTLMYFADQDKWGITKVTRMNFS
jgi:hypothetical protein